MPGQEWSLVQIKNKLGRGNNPLHVTTGAFANVHAFTAARARARVVTGGNPGARMYRTSQKKPFGV